MKSPRPGRMPVWPEEPGESSRQHLRPGCDGHRQFSLRPDTVFDPRPDDRGPHDVVAVFRDRSGHVRHYAVRRIVWKP